MLMDNDDVELPESSEHFQGFLEGQYVPMLVLERVLYQVGNANPRYGPVYLDKVDLVDGFCRVWLMVDAIPHLVVSFPKYPGEE